MKADVFPFPPLTFVRDELQAVGGSSRRQKVRNFWAVGTNGSYHDGVKAGRRHALDLVELLRSKPTNGDMTTLGGAMIEVQRRGDEGHFSRGVLVGFCAVLSKALREPWATLSDLNDIIQRDERSFERMVAEEGAAA